MISKYNKKHIIFVLQLSIIINAINLGWTIDHINHNKIILSKKISKYNKFNNTNNLYKLIGHIV
jgi:hypothetical protein